MNQLYNGVPGNSMNNNTVGGMLVPALRTVAGENK